MLAEDYDVALFDLDGVLYSGTDPIPHAADAVADIRRHGMRTVFVTNNASRSPQQVADLLDRVGIPARPGEVATSAQAAARVLAERLPAGSRVLICGAPALRAEVEAVGMVAVSSADDAPDAVAQGYDPEIGWRLLAEATVAVRAGALWVATNTDRTLPSPRGPLPGNGTLVQVVATATGSTPIVAGKPEPALHQESLERTGSTRPLVVGDRLDTDVEGADRAGCDSLLVLTGVATARDLVAAPPHQRPTYVAADLRGLLIELDQPAMTQPGQWALHGWTARADGSGGIVLDGKGADRDDALRVVCAVAWAPGADRAPAVSGASTAAADALGELGLS